MTSLPLQIPKPIKVKVVIATSAQRSVLTNRRRLRTQDFPILLLIPGISLVNKGDEGEKRCKKMGIEGK